MQRAQASRRPGTVPCRTCWCIGANARTKVAAALHLRVVTQCSKGLSEQRGRGNKGAAAAVGGETPLGTGRGAAVTELRVHKPGALCVCVWRRVERRLGGWGGDPVRHGERNSKKVRRGTLTPDSVVVDVVTAAVVVVVVTGGMVPNTAAICWSQIWLSAPQQHTRRMLDVPSSGENSAGSAS